VSWFVHKCKILKDLLGMGLWRLRFILEGSERSLLFQNLRFGIVPTQFDRGGMQPNPILEIGITTRPS